MARSIASRRDDLAGGAATASAIWSPQVKTGLSEVIGSWKIIEIWLPRTSRISSSESFSRSRPSSRISPSTILPGRPMRRMIDSAVMLLPQPDSPTTPSVLPSSIAKLTPSTALTMPSWVKKWVRRPLDLEQGASGVRSGRPNALVRDCRHHFDSMRWRGSRASRRPSPRKLAARTMRTIVTAGRRAGRPRLEVLLEVLQQVAQAGLGRADAEAEEREGGLGDHRVGDAERAGHDDRGERGRQHVPGDDPPVGWRRGRGPPGRSRPRGARGTPPGRAGGEWSSRSARWR